MQLREADRINRYRRLPMSLRPFREDKATQAAALLLRLRGGSMSYLKLLKLLYLADRRALLEWGRPITFDSYVCMDNGPVLSNTYRLITIEPDPHNPTYWSRYVSAPKEFEVELLDQSPPTDQLSRAEEELLNEVFERYGKASRWELVNLAHGLPEWRNPEGSTLPIEYRHILQAEGRSDDEIRAIEEGIEAEVAARDSLG